MATEPAAGSGRSVADIYQQVHVALVLKRFDRAERLIRDLAAADPDSYDVHCLTTDVALARGHGAHAEQAWRKAAMQRPDAPACAALGVRCALIRSDYASAWHRAIRLRTLAPNDEASHYWCAIAAVHAGCDDEAAASVATLARLAPTSDLVLHAKARVDLAISGRLKRRAVIAEQAVDELISRDPNSPDTHRLRQATLYKGRFRSGSHFAERRLQYATDAARVGVQPAPGELSSLTWDAVVPLGLAAAWLFLVAGGAPGIALVNGVLVGLCISAVWVCTYAFLWLPRLRRIVARLPRAGRRRLIRPIARSAAIIAGVFAVVGVGLAVFLAPYTRARAIEISVPRNPRTETRQVVITETVPTPPTVARFETLPRPGANDPQQDVTLFPPFGSPSRATLPPIRVPHVVTVRVASDVSQAQEHAVKSMQYMTTVALATMLFAVLVGKQAWRLHRA